MKTTRIDYRNIPDLPASSAAVGYFDGFHKGHQQLVREAEKTAEKEGLASAIITFDPDPWVIFRPEENRDHIMSLQDKEDMALSMGIEQFYILDFSREFSSLSPKEFENVIKEMNVRNLVCGFDYTYGYKGAGKPEDLKKQNDFSVEVIDSVNNQDQKISTTRIEKLIRGGLVKKASELLGSPYSISGIITHGYQRGGRLLGFPTANLKPTDSYVIPMNGVYAGYVQIDHQLYPAMINVGTNPTFGNDAVSVEANIFHFHEDIYGKKARFYFVERIRPEIRFSSAEQLKEQLEKDRKRCELLLSDPQ